jgi:hypothetical protein
MTQMAEKVIALRNIRYMTECDHRLKWEQFPSDFQITGKTFAGPPARPPDCLGCPASERKKETAEWRHIRHRTSCIKIF